MTRFRWSLISVGVLLLLVIAGVYLSSNLHEDVSAINEEAEKILDLESKKSFDFFWNEATTTEGSPGYGLIRDRAPGASGIASIASVGFGLSAYVIGVERGWVTYDEAYERTLGTLHTLLDHAEHVNGHFYHFLHMNTGKRAWESEVSVIDTAIAVKGAIVAGEYFGGEIKEKAQEVYERVDWEWYRDPKRNMFYMGYWPEREFAGHWDFYAEQLMVYFLGAASPTHPTNPEMFYDFQRRHGAYGGYPPFIYSWHGSIFTYQFSHAWFDLRHVEDREHVDWFKNSIIASLTDRQYAIDQSAKFKTYGPSAWGMTASDGPDGYSGHYGAVPNGYQNDANYVDGTIPPAGAAGSIVFTPAQSINALKHYYKTHPNLWGEYGFNDAFNINVEPEWYGRDVIGINKGITLLMIENYRTEFIWDLFMKNEFVQSGMRKVGLTPMNSLVIDDFEGNQLHGGWAENPDKFKVSNDRSFSGLHSLKLIENQSFNLVLDEIEAHDKLDSFRVKIYGKAKFNITLLNKNDDEIDSKSYRLKQADDWNDLVWNLTDNSFSVGDVHQIRFEMTDKKSEFIYVDDIEFMDSGPSAHHTFISGDTYVGQTLTGSYIFYDPFEGVEGNSNFQWLISDSANGEYVPIEGATEKTYVLQKEDKGKFIKFQVIAETKPEGIFQRKMRKGNRVESDGLLVRD
ncbi:glucoamylase family protein [Pseudogracilibacillus auburnensis]|uniref:glucoamylase family protein n=1 Tax=Pseudogracilibacillus auburnensis TaxID=1494959 RepID=UPI001A96B2E0|nr:glucoamylase family protein [Pseudogracilibacillus auburnensis]MBO1004828.1 hypothetical protein [Pseudogracilibacillus auburnensis]